METKAMDITQANEIIACLPKGRTLFPYYKDRYAAMILEQVAGDGIPIARLKASRFGKLLNRPAIMQIVATKGDGVLAADDMLEIQPEEYQYYVLTLGLWGWKTRDSCWQQTSRKGTNLVLQLNFSRDHDQLFRRLMDPSGNDPLAWSGHPVCRRGRNTLAWCRLDIDVKNRVALIEEVQNDWIRFALRALRRAQEQGGSCRFFRIDLRAARLRKYIETALAPHIRIWDEAMLAATIWFLRDELGIRRSYYHTYKTGAFLKKIGPDIMDTRLSWRDVATRLREPRFARKELAALYLDQAFLAGNGNYLRSEIIHDARLHPRARPSDLTRGELGRLARSTLVLSRRSYETGGITLAPRLSQSLKRQGLSRKWRRFYVFGRADYPCYHCGEMILREEVGSRRLYHCPGCQSGA